MKLSCALFTLAAIALLGVTTTVESAGVKGAKKKGASDWWWSGKNDDAKEGQKKRFLEPIVSTTHGYVNYGWCSLLRLGPDYANYCKRKNRQPKCTWRGCGTALSDACIEHDRCMTANHACCKDGSCDGLKIEMTDDAKIKCHDKLAQKAGEMSGTSARMVQNAMRALSVALKAKRWF